MDSVASKTEGFDYVFGKNVDYAYPEVTVSIERITPEVAAKMLETNVCNRDKKREPIADALRSGEWYLNGATIVFSYDGVLRDGQNRLFAIVDTGVSADTLIVRGVEPKSQETMDSGVKRTLADFLKMRGYARSKLVAAMASAMLKADTLGLGSFYMQHGSYQVTRTREIAYVEKNYEDRIEPIIGLCENVRAHFKCVRTGTIAPLFDAFMSVDEDSAIDFVRQMCGINTQCQPVQVLVKRLNDEDKDKSKTLVQTTIAAFIVKAWNAYMQGEEIGNLRFRKGGAAPESFPAIYEE